MDHKSFLWVLLLVGISLTLKYGFLFAIGPTLLLAALFYGGYYLCRRLLFWLGGVGGTDDGTDDSFKEWVEQNRKLPPK